MMNFNSSHRTKDEILKLMADGTSTTSSTTSHKITLCHSSILDAGFLALDSSLNFLWDAKRLGVPGCKKQKARQSTSGAPVL